jgi:hypothetical protein
MLGGSGSENGRQAKPDEADTSAKVTEPNRHGQYIEDDDIPF